MCEFIVFSDMHFNKNSNKSYVQSNNKTSWVNTQIDIFDQIFNYAKKNNVETVIHNGDLFEEKNRIPQELYNDVWEISYHYSNYFNIHFNIGNHDIVILSKVSNLKPFSPFVNVIFESGKVKCGDRILKFMPYGTQINIENGDILFTHDLISPLFNFKAVNVKYYEADVFKRCEVVFNGHIHSPIDYKNIVNIGSTMPHTWGEAGQRKRFIHYKDGNIKSVEIEHPEFIELDFIPKEVDNYSFFRLNVSSEELRNDIFKRYNVFPNVIKTVKRDSRIEETTSDENVINRYVDMSETTLNKELLKEIGRELLNDNS